MDHFLLEALEADCTMVAVVGREAAVGTKAFVRGLEDSPWVEVGHGQGALQWEEALQIQQRLEGAAT